MRKAKEIKEDLLASLVVSDSTFLEMGFKRRIRSFKYTRNIKEAKQILLIHGTCWPRHPSGAELHIYPYMLLSIKSVEKALVSLIPQESLTSPNLKFLLNNSNIIIGQPIDLIAQKIEGASWYVNGAEEIQEALLKLIDFFKRRVLSLFNEITTTEDLINFYREKNYGIINSEHWYLKIAAAHLAQGDLQGAQKTLEENLGELGQRMTYASIFKKLGLDPKIPK